MINLSAYKTHNELKELRATEKEAIAENRLKGNVLNVYKFLVGKSLTPSNLGACTYKVATIAEKLYISLATTTRCIKALKDLSLIEVINRTKGNGIKGANIYKILPFTEIEVFNEVCEKLELSYLEEAETPTVSKVEEYKKNDESLSFNLSSKSFKTSTLNNLYIHAYAHEEFLNEWQLTLIELLNSFKIDTILGEEFNKVIAATEITNAKEFHIAKDIIINMAKDLQSGRLSVDSTLRAVYKGAHKAKTQRDVLVVPEEVKATTERTVPFYNWLDERELTN